MMKQANQQAINVVWLVDKKFVKLCFLLRKLIKVVLSGERNGITAVNLSGTVFTQILSQPNYSLSALLIFSPCVRILLSSVFLLPPLPCHTVCAQQMIYSIVLQSFLKMMTQRDWFSLQKWPSLHRHNARNNAPYITQLTSFGSSVTRAPHAQWVSLVDIAKGKDLFPFISFMSPAVPSALLSKW